MNQEQLDEYVEQMNKTFDVEFYEMYKNNDTNDYELELKGKDEKVMRIIAIKDETFPIKNKDNIRIGAVAYTPIETKYSKNCPSQH